MKKIINYIALSMMILTFLSCNRDGYFSNLDTVSETPASVCIIVHTNEVINGKTTVVKQSGAAVKVYKVQADGTPENTPVFTKTTDENGYVRLNHGEMLQIFPESTNPLPTEARGGKLYIEASKQNMSGIKTSLNINMTDGETWIWVPII